MKNIALLSFLIISSQLFAQSEKDTTTILYNRKWEVITEGVPAYVGLLWKDGNKWHKQDYYYQDAKLQMQGLYADKELKVRDGLFSWFYENGMMSDSCQYASSLKTGTQATWDYDGNQTSLLHWHNNLPVDTAVWWNKEGDVTALQITDSTGNGIYQEFVPGGKQLRAKGFIYQGKRSGKWVFKDSNGVLAVEAMYNADSTISVTCFDEKGEQEKDKKDCLVEKQVRFKGGSDGWAKYLERNLRYPDDAMKAGIQGVVRIDFVVGKDGLVSDAKVVSAPSESLGKEALRIIKQSPKWEPGTKYNRYVVYRHVQSITFHLQ